MKATITLAAALLLGGAAGAQLIGAHPTVTGTVGAVGQSATGTVGAGVDVANPAPTVRQTTRDTTRTVEKTTDSGRRTVASATRRDVKVEAGASVRVAQGTRCYYDDYYYDPVYRDGTYYCERTGPGAAAGVKVGGK